ncbi:MAG: protein kinase [Planctomycetes bacterium]|nr:protein kinase [Planctomycetota bacterium]
MPADPKKPLAPRKTVGKFTLLRELGRGGMGVVYLAHDNDLGRDVALKMLLSAETSPVEMERFRREARAAAKLRHPNIVPVYETGTESGKAYFAMEFVKGRSLERGLKEAPLRRRAEIVRDVARALEFAHGLGVVHRDIKPANIMLAEDGRPVVMDFGLAKHMGDARNLTQAGTIMGTPNYMSPEQATGDPGAIDGRSDVFALGAVLYFLITDKPPFERVDSVQTVLAVLHDAPVLPRKILHDVPRDLETICLKALAKKPEKRFQSAEEMAADLDRYLAGTAIAARPPGSGERAIAWAARHPAKLAAGAVAAVGLAAVIGVWASGASERSGRDRQAAEAAEKKKLEDAAIARKSGAADFVRVGREQLDVAEKCMMTGRADDLRASLARAIEAFGKALAADDACAEAFAGRGRALRLRGETDAAIKDLARAGQLAPKLAEAPYELGLARLDLFIEAKNAAQAEPSSGGQPSPAARLARDRQLAAAEDLSRAASLPPSPGREWMPIHAHAAIAFLAGKLADARADLDQVITKSPFRDDALALRAYILLLGAPPDTKGAIEDLDRAIQANALSVSHRNLRGVAKGLAGDTKGALADFDAAIDLDPHFVPALLNRSSSRLAAADSAGAEADAGKVLAVEKDNLLALRARAEARLAQRHFPDAEADFTRALDLAPEALALRVRRAAVRRLGGKYREAAEDAKLALKSEDPDVRFNAAGEYLESIFAEATEPTWQETMVQVEAAFMAAPPLKPDEILKMIAGLRKNGHTPAARAMMKEFLKRYPEDPRAPGVQKELQELEGPPR